MMFGATPKKQAADDVIKERRKLPVASPNRVMAGKQAGKQAGRQAG